MKRYKAVAACAIIALSLGLPASAESVVVEGYVAVPSGSPQPARMLYRTSGGAINGMVGYVAEIPTSAEARSYTLTAGDRGVDTINLDAWFYTDIAGLGEPCARASEDLVGGGERGSVCPDARFVVVVLLYGADTDFTLSIV